MGRPKGSGVRPVMERFLGMVDKNDQSGCWIWTGGKVGHGYGSFRVDGKTKIAHRIAYEYWVGEIIDGYEIDHLCRNRLCVNPAHLALVTHEQNMARSINAIKTHCHRGHPLSGGNLTSSPGYAKRQCRECRRVMGNASARRRYAARKA